MNIDLIVQILPVFIAIFIVAYPIYIAITRSRAENGIITPGFKGWLFIFMISMWLGLFRYINEVTRLFSNMNTTNLLNINYIDILIIGIDFIFYIWLLILMINKSAKFVNWFRVYFMILVFVFPINVLFSIFIVNNNSSDLVNMEDLLIAVSREFGQWMVGVIGAGLWLIYLRTSRRVAITFSGMK